MNRWIEGGLRRLRRRDYIVLVFLLLAACGGAVQDAGGPQLVQDVTLEATTPPPTRIITPTPTPTPIVIPVSTSEINSPLEIVTQDVDFVLVTPTLPPSKTPTTTPTATVTFTPTVTPITLTATLLSEQFPTAIVVPVTAIVANPQPRVCDSTWFFIQPRPASCPVSEPIASQATFQQFENGFMLWVQAQDTVYVMYTTANQPRWQSFIDPFVDPTPERPEPVTPPAQLYQPRRGFGEIWRLNPTVRQRIGWAVQQWEDIYSVQAQTADDGSIFLQGPRGDIFQLFPGGTEWQRFGTFGQ